MDQLQNMPGVGPEGKLRVCVAIQDDGLSGIETYAEQVAIASATAGHDTTLIVTTEEVAQAVRERVSLATLRIVEAGIKPRSAARVLADRLMPDLHTRRVGEAFARAVRSQNTTYDVIHLNRPGLARWAEPFGGQLFVAGWFFPHAAGPRVVETWRHTRGFLPRRAVITAKALSYYAGDQRGYRAATSVVACTETLASQLRSQGLRAVSCPPPVRVPKRAQHDDVPPSDGSLRLVICSGDLSHPRKNLRDAVRAAAELARPDRPVLLRAIGCHPEAIETEARRVELWPGARLELECLGVLAPAEVHREMRRAHALLLPSLYEEWGYVAIESILSGTPVASYPVYPFADMLQNGVGIVAEDLTPKALAAAVEQCLTLPRGELLATMGEDRFGARTLGMRLTQIWHEAGAKGLDVPAPRQALPASIHALAASTHTAPAKAQLTAADAPAVEERPSVILRRAQAAQLARD
ncbi:MAG TPA: glycosyltransferase family 4 protein [Polyangiales bacterium]|nr:glycosyltransferase family 4 protein [Polyangiales bacterium]